MQTLFHTNNQDSNGLNNMNNLYSQNQNVAASHPDDFASFSNDNFYTNGQYDSLTAAFDNEALGLSNNFDLLCQKSSPMDSIYCNTGTIDFDLFNIDANSASAVNMSVYPGTWCEKEDKLLRKTVKSLGSKNWKQVRMVLFDCTSKYFVLTLSQRTGGIGNGY